jgi:hypothetical protein
MYRMCKSFTLLISGSLIANLTVNAQKALRSSGDADQFGDAVMKAMDEVMGCGARKADAVDLEGIRQSILPMWNTMPKSNGRLDWKSVRYVAHRFFMQKSSLLIRGFEPSRVVSGSDSGAADVLSRAVPEHADMLLGGTHGRSGFSLDDTVSFLAALERLVFDSESDLLHVVYKQFGMEPSRLLSAKQTRRLIEAYMVSWMLGEDQKSTMMLLRNRTLLETSFPHWASIKNFVDGRIRTLDFQRAQNPKGYAQSIMSGRYSFDDVHEVVGGITQSFQLFWESECAAMKAQLVDMDKYGTGRVRLSDFYGTGLDVDWRFGESESYLRDLGVLDESSPWRGKQVIISNYLQAASNCIVSTTNYLVCCINECEHLLGDIETSIGQPTASPEELISVLSNMSSPSDPNDAPPKLAGALTEQLSKIAETSGGVVPLHGRLFAQFMHYAFPRECPFPHKAGSFSSHTLTPQAYGDGKYLASKDDMRSHASERDASDEMLDGQEDLNMWSEEEELFADYGTSGGGSATKIFLGLGAIAGLVALATGVIGGNSKASGLPMYRSSHSHLV